MKEALLAKISDARLIPLLIVKLNNPVITELMIIIVRISFSIITIYSGDKYSNNTPKSMLNRSVTAHIGNKKNGK
jgi:hypothetical protein